MSKLEIKHLAPYLPYDLSFYYESLDGTKQHSWILSNDKIDFALQMQNKPILRPLSDLNKEIIINGEKRQMWLLINGQKALQNGKIENMNGYQYDILELSYSKIQTILKFHFDVFGLIPKGLAVDINTLSVE